MAWRGLRLVEGIRYSIEWRRGLEMEGREWEGTSMEGPGERSICEGATEVSFGSVVALGADVVHAAAILELEIAPPDLSSRAP